MKKAIYTLLTLALITTIVFAGCDVLQTATEEPSSVQVQMQVKNSTVAAKQMTTLNEENGIEIEEVKLFVEEMELDGVNKTADFELEYFIVDLPLDGSPIMITEKEIPAGIYDEFELEIEKPDDDDLEVNDTDFRDETGSYSVVVKGFYNGEAFTFRSSEDFEIEVDLYPPLEISDTGSSNLVVEIDVNSWFKGKDGEDLDPKDYRNTELINENIERSFEAFEDDFEEYDFEGYVQSVDLTEQTFTLTNGLLLHVSNHTKFEDDLKSLEELEHAISEGYTVEADGEYYIDSSGRNMVIELDLEIEDDDDDN